MARLAISALLALVAFCLAAPNHHDGGPGGGGSARGENNAGYQQGVKVNYGGHEGKGAHRMRRHYHDGLSGYGGGGGGGGGYGGLGGPAYGGLVAIPVGNSQSFSKSSASATSMSGGGGGGYAG